MFAGTGRGAASKLVFARAATSMHRKQGHTMGHTTPTCSAMATPYLETTPMPTQATSMDSVAVAVAKGSVTGAAATTTATTTNDTTATTSMGSAAFTMRDRKRPQETSRRDRKRPQETSNDFMGSSDRAPTTATTPTTTASTIRTPVAELGTEPQQGRRRKGFARRISDDAFHAAPNNHNHNNSNKNEDKKMNNKETNNRHNNKGNNSNNGAANGLESNNDGMHTFGAVLPNTIPPVTVVASNSDDDDDGTQVAVTKAMVTKAMATKGIVTKGRVPDDDDDTQVVAKPTKPHNQINAPQVAAKIKKAPNQIVVSTSEEEEEKDGENKPVNPGNPGPTPRQKHCVPKKRRSPKQHISSQLCLAFRGPLPVPAPIAAQANVNAQASVGQPSTPLRVVMPHEDVVNEGFSDIDEGGHRNRSPPQSSQQPLQQPQPIDTISSDSTHQPSQQPQPVAATSSDSNHHQQSPQQPQQSQPVTATQKNVVTELFSESDDPSQQQRCVCLFFFSFFSCFFLLIFS